VPGETGHDHRLRQTGTIIIDEVGVGRCRGGFRRQRGLEKISPVNGWRGRKVSSPRIINVVSVVRRVVGSFR